MTAPVVIVGAGPVGLTAALLLARQGVRSVILERHAKAFPLPRAVHLDDEVHRILQAIGLQDTFRRISRPTLGMRLVDARHRTMAEFRRSRPIGVHGYPPANLFDQPELEALLRGALPPEVELRTGVEVVAIDGLTLFVKGGGTMVARAILGCDGANSVTRTAIGATLTDLGFEERWCVIDARISSPLDAWDGVHQVCDPARAATYMRVGADRYRWEFRLHDGERVADLSVSSLVTPWTRGAPVEVIRAQEYTFRARVADRWRLGRVFLLGDAAHLTPPFIGQGLGSGLRDAFNLSWKLAAVLRWGADERLLDTYEAERLPHARALVRTAVKIGWAMTGGQDAAAAVRRAVLAAAVRLPGFTTSALEQASPRLRPGPLVASRRGLAGTLIPQPWIAPDVRLDDALGLGFALISLGPPDPSAVAAAAAIDAKVLVVDPSDAGGEVGDEGLSGVVRSAELAGWLRRGRARYALVRPDRVVLAAAGSGRALLGAVLPCVALLPPFHPHAEGVAA